MIPPHVVPTVRRAILDLMDAIGGEQSDDTITLQLTAVGHPVARRDVAEQLRWLATQQLVETQELGPYLVATILPDGSDVAAGRLRIDGIWRHKTGKRAGTAR